jgi:hypothetical protein
MSLIPGRHRNKLSYRPTTGKKAKKSKIKTEKSKMVFFPNLNQVM